MELCSLFAKCSIYFGIIIFLLITPLPTNGFNGKLINTGVLKISEMTLEKCAKACLEEIQIKCQYFKFVNNSGDCYLSETDHPSLQGGDTPTTTKPINTELGDEYDEAIKSARQNENMIKILHRKLEHLEHRIKQLQEVELNLKDYEEKSASADSDQDVSLENLRQDNVKEQKGMVQLKERLYSLTQKAKDIFSQIKSLRSSHESMESSLKGMSTTNNNVTGNLQKLAIITDVIAKDLNSLKKFVGTENKNMSKLKNSNGDIERKLDTLQNELNKKGSVKEVNMVVNGMKQKQAELTNALNMVNKKEKDLEVYLGRNEENMDKLKNKISKTAMGKNAIAEEVEKLKGNIMELQNNIQQLADPVSPQNKKWRKNLEQVQSSVLRLADSDKKLASEMKSTKQDLASLLEDLTSLQLNSQDMKLQLSSLNQVSAQLKSDVDDLKSSKNHAPSIVQMAKMETNILNALAKVEREGKRFNTLIDKYEAMTQKLKSKVDDQQSDTEKRDEAVKDLEKSITEISQREEQVEKGVNILLNKETTGEDRVIQIRLQKNQKELDSKINIMRDVVKGLHKSITSLEQTALDDAVQRAKLQGTKDREKTDVSSKQDNTGSSHSLKAKITGLQQDADELQGTKDREQTDVSSKQDNTGSSHSLDAKITGLQQDADEDDAVSEFANEIEEKVNRINEIEKSVNQPETNAEIDNESTTGIPFKNVEEIDDDSETADDFADRSETSDESLQDFKSTKAGNGEENIYNNDNITAYINNSENMDTDFETSSEIPQTLTSECCETKDYKQIATDLQNTSSGADCNDGYIKADQSCYKFMKEFVTHSDANTKCAEQGGSLVRPDSLESQTEMETFLKEQTNALASWIGSILWNDQINQYVWNGTDKAVSYFNFRGSWKPNSYLYQHLCPVSTYHVSWKWLPYDCERVRTNKMTYLCEIKLNFELT